MTRRSLVLQKPGGTKYGNEENNLTAESVSMSIATRVSKPDASTDDEVQAVQKNLSLNEISLRRNMTAYSP